MNIKILLVVVFTLTTSLAQYRDLGSKNRFAVGARLQFNISADMKNIPVPANAGPFFDDGAVADDSSLNAGGKTWNWSFVNTNQIVQTPGGPALELHGAPSPRDGTTDRLEQPLQYGFELTYGRELFYFGNKEDPMILGIEASFGGSALGLEMNNTVYGTVARSGMRFPFGSVIPPNLPYTGSFEGPGPLITTNGIPIATTMESASATQNAKIEGTYWGFRLGPFFELPLDRGWELQFATGISIVHADAKLTYLEGFAITGLGGAQPQRTDSQSRADWLFGFYAEARAQFWMTDFVALYGGVQYQILEDFTLQAANKEATVDFGNSIGVVLGVIYAF